MSQISIGDLAQSYLLRHQSTQLGKQIGRLSTELISGRASDLTRHLSGGFNFYADIQHNLTVQSSYQTSAREAQFTTAAMQTALEHVHTLTGGLANTAVTAGTISSGTNNMHLLAEEGRNVLGSIVGALNARTAERALFSGIEVTNTSLASAEDILTALQGAIAGASSAADVQTAMDNFFDAPGGGFETLIYQGSTDYLAPIQLSENETVTLGIRADDPAIRAALKETALAALLDDPSMTIPEGDKAELTKSIGESLFSAQRNIAGLRADLGFFEGQVEQSLARISAQMTSLEIARNELDSIDPFETASELEQVQTQLETLYTLTARTSRLSLVNFLS